MKILNQVGFMLEVYMKENYKRDKRSSSSNESTDRTIRSRVNEWIGFINNSQLKKKWQKRKHSLPFYILHL